MIYQDKDFAFKDGKFNIDNLMLIGWMYNRHWSEETQTRELWHIINPMLEPVATKDMVLDVATKLVYIAINLNIKILKAQKENSAELKAALAYHDRIAKNRRAYVQKLQRDLPDECTIDDIKLHLDQFYRTYDLRLTIAGDKAPEDNSGSPVPPLKI